MTELKHPTKSHPGRAGRKPAPFPFFTKKLRATAEEWRKFLSLLTGDSRKDFQILYNALLDETKKDVEVAEQIERRFIENTDEIIDKMKKTGFIS